MRPPIFPLRTLRRAAVSDRVHPGSNSCPTRLPAQGSEGPDVTAGLRGPGCHHRAPRAWMSLHGPTRDPFPEQ